MKHVIPSLFLTLLIGLSSCAPDPSMVCDHYMSVFENDPEAPGFVTSDDTCVKRMEKIKKLWGVNSYRREVECGLAVDTAYKLRKCIKDEETRH